MDKIGELTIREPVVALSSDFQYTPFWVSVSNLSSIPWSNSEYTGVATFSGPLAGWVHNNKLELALVDYSNELLYFHNGRHRTKWLMGSGLKRIPIYLHNHTIADAILEGFVRGADRGFFGEPITLSENY
jgi:hypothetical protein